MAEAGVKPRSPEVQPSASAAEPTSGPGDKSGCPDPCPAGPTWQPALG